MMNSTELSVAIDRLVPGPNYYAKALRPQTLGEAFIEYLTRTADDPCRITCDPSSPWQRVVFTLLGVNGVRVMVFKDRSTVCIRVGDDGTTTATEAPFTFFGMGFKDVEI